MNRDIILVAGALVRDDDQRAARSSPSHEDVADRPLRSSRAAKKSR
jgi:hypothetical protein